jgi:hypothetical protein
MKTGLIQVLYATLFSAVFGQQQECHNQSKRSTIAVLYHQGESDMSRIASNEAFREALSTLSLAQQRAVSARFIANVLDLTQDSHVKHAQALFNTNDEISAENLDSAFQEIHSIYAQTYPRSHFSLFDYSKQAEHFVAEACLHCLAPTYYEAKKHHLAERVSMYCLMARTCASIDHEGNYPKFAGTEDLVKKEVDAQYEILSEYLASI